jgi:hypothetical protein
MWTPLVLSGHSLRRMRSLLLTMTVILTAFQLLLAALADWLGTSSAFSQLAAMVPPAVRQLMGPWRWAISIPRSRLPWSRS